jgi:23S rRNA pseudouridine2604 synthase
MAFEKNALIFPMRINKYLALKKYCTRREADVWIEKKLVYINGVHAVIGQQVNDGDKVTVRGRQKKFSYIAYNKPVGIVTHSPQEGEQEIKDIFPVKGVFPMGRLDKDSSGLIILTDDGRITDALLNPAQNHDKEYEVETLDELPSNFKKKMEAGVDIGGYTTKPCIVKILGKRNFSIILTEGKNRQIRRMCGAFGQSVERLTRVRILNIRLGALQEGESRAIEGAEFAQFLSTLGMTAAL